MVLVLHVSDVDVIGYWVIRCKRDNANERYELCEVGPLAGGSCHGTAVGEAASAFNLAACLCVMASADCGGSKRTCPVPKRISTSIAIRPSTMLMTAAAIRMPVGASVLVIAKCGIASTQDDMYVANGTNSTNGRRAPTKNHASRVSTTAPNSAPRLLITSQLIGKPPISKGWYP